MSLVAPAMSSATVFFISGVVASRCGWLKFPIPFGNRLPIGRGADEQPLQNHFVGRHGRLVEHARHVVDLPVMDGACRRRPALWYT